MKLYSFTKIIGMTKITRTQRVHRDATCSFYFLIVCWFWPHLHLGYRYSKSIEEMGFRFSFFQNRFSRSKLRFTLYIFSDHPRFVNMRRRYTHRIKLFHNKFKQFFLSIMNKKSSPGPGPSTKPNPGKSLIWDEDEVVD